MVATCFAVEFKGLFFGFGDFFVGFWGFRGFCSFRGSQRHLSSCAIKVDACGLTREEMLEAINGALLSRKKDVRFGALLHQ